MDAEIRTVFSQVFSIPASRVTDQLSWNDLEQWDSLGHIRLIDALREQFNIEIPADQALEMESVREIKRIVSLLINV